MEFSIATLLASFADDKLVAPKALEKKLDCKDEQSLRKLQIALDALEKIGILVKERGRYRRVQEDDVVSGKLRCSSKGFCFAIQDDEDAEDIYIRECHLNTAWNGDRVLVRITKEGSRRRSPEGEVRLILERANSSVLARVKHEEEYRAVPLDDRLLFEIDLKSDEAILANAVDYLVNVEILRYPLGQHRPMGRIAKVLGSDAEAAADTDIVCCKHGLPLAFSDVVLEAAKGLPAKVRKTDLKGRLDLRSLLTVTIDGYSQDISKAQAVDDAISLERTPEGHWRLGVHIADVASYVPPNSAIDRAAQRRGTSVYLGDVVVPMLPDRLSEQLCCLTPEQDRLAVSVLMTLTDDGQLLEYELQPTVISVDYHLSYQQAQAVLERNAPISVALDDDSSYPLPSADEIEVLKPTFELVDNVYTLSQALKNKRHERGAFELNLPEKLFPREHGGESDDTATALDKYLLTKFHYDDEGALGSMVVSSALPAHSMVVELMLLANHAVARHLQALELPGIYRVHRTPDPADVQELMKLASNMGINLVLENEEEVHPHDYQRFTGQFAESEAERVLTYLLLSTLRPAVYSALPGTHFGLALTDGYTHFTSPVRRYPDLLVQRVLHAIFEHGRDRRSTRVKESVNLRHSSCHGQIGWKVLPPEVQSELEAQINSLVIHLTERERVALEAEADLEGLKKAEFMKAHTGSTFHGLITGVQSYGFFVEIEELLVEGLVHVSSLKDDWYEYRSRQQKLVGRKNRKQYRLGDRVEVQVKSVDYYRQQIDLVAVGGGSQGTDDDIDDDGPDFEEDETE